MIQVLIIWAILLLLLVQNYYQINYLIGPSLRYKNLFNINVSPSKSNDILVVSVLGNLISSICSYQRDLLIQH